MLERLLTPLLETLRPHFDLSKTRLEALARTSTPLSVI